MIHVLHGWMSGTPQKQQHRSFRFRSQKDSWQPDQLGPNQPVLADEALKPFSPHRPPNSSLLARKLKLLKPVGPP